MLFYSSTPLPQNPAPSPPSTSPPPSTPVTSFVVSSAKTKLLPSLKPNNYPTNTYTTSIASRRWLELHASCSLCKFQLEEEEKGDDGIMTKIKREIIVRLTEEDFYGLRTTLNHIASRHALIEENENRGPQIGEASSLCVSTSSLTIMANESPYRSVTSTPRHECSKSNCGVFMSCGNE
ncbi:hypothetical protein JHK82_018053 [Glycine max]|nr:hypothetical protein JHK82_018053 [Glycine max]